MKAYTKFIDEIGTVFERVYSSDKGDYRFITPDGDIDFCTIQQIESWGITIAEIIEE